MSFVYNKPKICKVCGDHYLACRKDSSACEKCVRKFNLHQDYLQHRSERLKKTKQWAEDHRDRVNELRRLARIRNPGLFRAREIRYQSKPTSKEAARIRVINRRARLRNAEGSFSFEEWLNLCKKFKRTCPMCGKSEPEIKLSVDHIVPLIKSGSNFIKNIQPLCIKCNQIKATKVRSF